MENRFKLSPKYGKLLRQSSMVLALVGIVIIFAFLTGGTFIEPRNISTLYIQTSYIAILALGMVFVIVAGHIDLSVGSLVGFTGAVAAVLHVKMGLGTVPSILITLLVGILIGAWQGYWVAYRGVPAFIVTLAGMLLFRGAVIALTKGETIAPLESSFSNLGRGTLPQIVFPEGSWHFLTLILILVAMLLTVYSFLHNRAQRIKYNFEVPSPWVEFIKIFSSCIAIFILTQGMLRYRGVSYPVLILIVLAIMYNMIANRTTFGRYIYAIGGNKEAAFLSGINIKVVNFMIFVSMGFLSAVGGIIFTARLNSATASAGTNFELDTIAAVIIGGTSTLGGEGTIFGALIGALVMSSLNNGMSLLNVPTEYQAMVKGLILLLAVWFDVASRKKQR